MKTMTEAELRELLESREKKQRLELKEYEFHNMDMTGWNFSNTDVSLSSFQGSILDGVNFENSSVENALFDGCPMKGTNFKNANMKRACFRSCDLGGANIEGADLFFAVLELANLEGVKADENTKWYRLYCPEEGAFLGYKKCIGDRLVQLLIPADAKRTSATYRTCRCDKAKVLTIKSFDYKESFSEAWSMVDENFVYRVGEWVEVKDFNEDRWFDSTTGIHFWLTREEAKAY